MPPQKPENIPSNEMNEFMELKAMTEDPETKIKEEQDHQAGGRVPNWLAGFATIVNQLGNFNFLKDALVAQHIFTSEEVEAIEQRLEDLTKYLVDIQRSQAERSDELPNEIKDILKNKLKIFTA